MPHRKKEHIKISKYAKFQQDWPFNNKLLEIDLDQIRLRYQEASILTTELVQCVYSIINCAQGEQNLHSKWNLILTFTEFTVAMERKWRQIRVSPVSCHPQLFLWLFLTGSCSLGPTVWFVRRFVCFQEQTVVATWSCGNTTHPGARPHWKTSTLPIRWPTVSIRISRRLFFSLLLVKDCSANPGAWLFEARLAGLMNRPSGLFLVCDGLYRNTSIVMLRAGRDALGCLRP